MDPPNTDWQETIFHPVVVSELDDGFDACQKKLRKYCEKRWSDGPVECETPVSIALCIGDHAVRTHAEHLSPVIDDRDDTGKELARGYIGARAIEEMN